MYNAGNNSWTQIGGAMAEVASSENHIWAVTADRSTLVEWNNQPWNGGLNPFAWITIRNPGSGSYAHLFAGLRGPVVTNTDTGAAYTLDDSADNWTEIGPVAGTYAIGASDIYSLSTDSNTVSEWNRQPWTGGTAPAPWLNIGGPAATVVTGS